MSLKTSIGWNPCQCSQGHWIQMLPFPNPLFLEQVLRPIIKGIEFRSRCNLCNSVSIWSPIGALGHNLLLKTVTYLLETWPSYCKELIEWTQQLKQQQHATSVPHREIVVFGDLLQHTSFIRAFEDRWRTTQVTKGCLCFKKQEFLRFWNTKQENVEEVPGRICKFHRQNTVQGNGFHSLAD